jgi:acetyl esterase/lipase
MAVGMKFHHFADPRPPSPDFKIVIPSRLSPRGGTFRLVFYVPAAYFSDEDDTRFPVVVNFHGGGFTLGTGTDDARWAASVVQATDAVFVSVEYRLAPEYPFSVGVEDGTDALIYLAAHAEELRLDPHRMALSGFSAGGNFAFTVPLMLHDLRNGAGRRTLNQPLTIHDAPSSWSLRRPPSSKTLRHPPSSMTLRKAPTSHLPTTQFQSSSTLSLPRPYASRNISSKGSVVKLTDLEPTVLEMANQLPDLTILCIVSFYPAVDFRRSRAEKRATNPMPTTNLSPSLTNLFDQSYLTPSGCDLSDPYLSPAAASDDFLRDAYPEDIVLYTCEYDMLNAEGVAFGERLSSPAIGKTVHGGLIRGVQHAFDKKPNPISFPKAADQCYAEACAELKRVFGGRSSVDDRRQLEQDYEVFRFDGEEEGDVVLGEGGSVGTRVYSNHSYIENTIEEETTELEEEQKRQREQEQQQQQQQKHPDRIINAKGKAAVQWRGWRRPGPISESAP